MIGKTILHYKITEKLGEGGMGIVYKADDTRLKREVALKFLPTNALQGADEKERFLREAQAAAALNHPNVATIYEIDEAEGQIFIAMEYIEGRDLKSIVDDGPLTIDDALDYAIQIAEGLSKAHSKGIIHRDIKPANILVTEDGVMKIVDFGLAKLAGRTMLTKEGTTLGTVAYMSPEQAQGSEVDHRTDIWALGAVIYEMITGQQPFIGDYEQAVMYSIMNEDPEPPTGLRTGVPMALERIVLKALAKEPGERYQRIDEMLVDLKNLRKSQDVSIISKTSNQSGDLTGVETRSGLKTRTRFKSGLIAGAVAAALLLALLYLLRPSRPDTTKSIAVLPLVNQRGDPDLEYLSDGITERLIDHLSPISGLKVLARSTVFHFKGADLGPIKAGEELHVGTVLSGRLDQRQEHLIVGVELVDVRTGEQLWGERFNRKMTDIFEIEEEISRNISEKLKLRLGLNEQTRLGKRDTENTEAYQLYLKGRYYWNKRSPEAMPVALDYFQRAVQLDQNFALAWTGIADCYGVSFGLYLNVSSNDAFSKARSAVQTALRIDESLAEAQASLGMIESGEWHWQAAQRAFERALALNPGYASAHQWYGEHLYIVGRYGASVTELQRALELDPLSLIINSVLGWSYLASRNAAKAIAQFQRTLDMEPNFFDAQDGLVQALILSGRPDKEVFPQLVKRDNLLRIFSAQDIDGFRAAFKQEGTKGYWRSRLSVLSERSDATRWLLFIAECYTQLGAPEKALSRLEAMVKRHDPLLSYVRIWVFFDPLRAQPRFQDIVRQMNFPD